MDCKNRIKEIKRQFFTYRNGALGDALRRQGAPFKIIFGLNIIQLNNIAKSIIPDKVLAQQLWDNRSTRESLLLATMIYPRDDFDKETATIWIKQIPTQEIADVLCLNLLKQQPYAIQLADEMICSDNDIMRYTALRLMLSQFPNRYEHAEECAKEESKRQCPITKSICSQIIIESNYLKEDNMEPQH